ncbi:prepilin peptidase [Desmospora profundinema]|uniref:Flp pilus assembly protein protease CpaA n=1 Tax=Desmospora profundinema TaxID=1571184 RepID=A0ABU1IQK8_9BACL|nr:A24 family peptidase [Desmospora profundinema]MDR6227074.1 Flp pilus assembly protein protease CpaA [Desmospora profundinema]
MAEHVLYWILIGLLIAATVTDLRERLIYDRFVLIGVAAAVIIRMFHRPEPWWNYILTGVIVLIVLTVIAALTNERSIGGGDVKLFAMIGLAVGWEPFLSIFLLSHVLAAVVVFGVKLFRWSSVGKHTEFPFAPFILAAVLVVYWFQ